MILRYLFAEPPLQPFCGQLDRRERVLDFMRDTPRHIGPSSAPLICQLLADVLECHHAAQFARRHGHRHRYRIGSVSELHHAALLALGQLRQRRGYGFETLADNRFALAAQQFLGVELASWMLPPSSIETTPADIDSSTASMKMRRSPSCRFVVINAPRLSFQTLGHSVEGFRKETDLVIAILIFVDTR